MRSHAELLRRLRDPFWLVPRLHIVDIAGAIRPIRTLRGQQIEFVETFFRDNRPIFVVKPRQVGITTIACACFVAHMLTSPGAEALIQIAHEGAALASLNQKIRVMLQGLPPELRPHLPRDTANHIEMGHNHGSFTQQMAGGRGQGKSFTYQHDHHTEMGSWPTGSSAVKGRGVDRQVWSSIRATRHNTERGRTVVESTAHGPGGLFYTLYQAAAASSQWNLLFWPWFYDDEYALKELPKGWERTDEENEMLAKYADKGLTDLHLAWRRRKMVDEDQGPVEFRQNYPSNRDEPFLIDEKGAVFDIQALNNLAAFTDTRRFPGAPELVIYEEPHLGHSYGIGMDTSAGVGRDWAVAYVVRDDGKLVARWHSNKKPPAAQAAAVAQLSSRYGAPVLVEYNRHGKFVFHELARLGARLWRDANGKPWWTQRGANSNSKDRLIDFAAALVQEGHFLPSGAGDSRLADSLLILELASLTESDKGNLEAPEGKHDDHAMAWMLALWCVRGHLRKRPQKLWAPPEHHILRPYDMLAGTTGSP